MNSLPFSHAVFMGLMGAIVFSTIFIVFMYSKWFIKLFRRDVKASFISMIAGILLSWSAYSFTQLYQMTDSDLRGNFLRLDTFDQSILNVSTFMVFVGALLHIHGYCDAIGKMYLFYRISYISNFILIAGTLLLWKF
jgi:hypothetical protein